MQTMQLYRLRLVREGQLSYAPVTQPYEAQQAIHALLHTLLHDRDREAAVAIALDARNRPIGAHVIGRTVWRRQQVRRLMTRRLAKP